MSDQTKTNDEGNLDKTHIEFEKIKGELLKIKPSFSGNSRNCYMFENQVVLVENADLQKVERAKQIQSFCNSLVKMGVNTARISSLSFEDGCLYWVEDKMPGHPVYFRNENSYCLSKNLPMPISQSKIDNELKDEFFKEKGMGLSDYFSLNKEQRKAFNQEMEIFKQERMHLDPALKAQVEYSNKINLEVKEQNELYAKEYAQADQKHFDKFLSDITILTSLQGSNVDCHSDNFLYDNQSGFSLIDIEASQTENIKSNYMGMSVGFMIDILTRGTDDIDIQTSIISKCLTSAQKLGINIENVTCIPSSVKEAFTEATLLQDEENCQE